MILGIIPARGESSKIKDKNIQLLNGVPLIEYTICHAMLSLLSDWFVFTEKYTNYKTLGIKRLTKFSQGEYNSVIHWLPYAISQYEQLKGCYVDVVCLLQPTSPLRTYVDIDRAINLFIMSGVHSLTSGSLMRIKVDNKVDGKGNKEHYQRNGAIFMFDKYQISTGKLFDKNTYKMVMPKSRSIDIDTLEDFFIAESLLKNNVFEKEYQ